MPRPRCRPCTCPARAVRNQFYELLHSPDPAEYQRNYTFDISPVTDNRPFFFYTVQPRDLWTFVTNASQRKRRLQDQRAVPLLFG